MVVPFSDVNAVGAVGVSSLHGSDSIVVTLSGGHGTFSGSSDDPLDFPYGAVAYAEDGSEVFTIALAGANPAATAVPAMVTDTEVILTSSSVTQDVSFDLCPVLQHRNTTSAFIAIATYDGDCLEMWFLLTHNDTTSSHPVAAFEQDREVFVFVKTSGDIGVGESVVAFEGTALVSYHLSNSGPEEVALLDRNLLVSSGIPAVVPYLENSFIAIGETAQSETTIFRRSSHGNILWEVPWSCASFVQTTGLLSRQASEFFAVLQCNDTLMVGSGYVSPPGIPHTAIVRLSESGDLLDVRNFTYMGPLTATMNPFSGDLSFVFESFTNFMWDGSIVLSSTYASSSPPKHCYPYT